MGRCGTRGDGGVAESRTKMIRNGLKPELRAKRLAQEVERDDNLWLEAWRAAL